jgi:hypothetical protein
LEADRPGNTFSRLSAARSRIRIVRRPHDLYLAQMLFMTRLMFLMTAAAFLMVGSMLFTLQSAVLMILMINVKSGFPTIRDSDRILRFEFKL